MLLSAAPAALTTFQLTKVCTQQRYCDVFIGWHLYCGCGTAAVVMTAAGSLSGVKTPLATFIISPMYIVFTMFGEEEAPTSN